eukprot:g6032.t1
MLRASLIAAVIAAAAAQDHPHLAQAWQANSVGDGQQGMTGLESYIYEGCGHRPNPPTSDTCMHAHKYDYGAACVKYEVDAGFKSAYSGTFYVNCDSVDCCKTGQIPDLKMWDIGQAKKSTITHFGAIDIKDLDGPVPGADTWNEVFKLPFTPISINYTYYITKSGNDTISHRIDFSEPGDSHAQNGQILYGNFTVKHADELDAFRSTFHAPAACLKPNTLTCNNAQVKAWDRKFFRGRH